MRLRTDSNVTVGLTGVQQVRLEDPRNWLFDVCRDTKPTSEAVPGRIPCCSHTHSVLRLPFWNHGTAAQPHIIRATRHNVLADIVLDEQQQHECPSC